MRVAVPVEGMGREGSRLIVVGLAAAAAGRRSGVETTAFPFALPFLPLAPATAALPAGDAPAAATVAAALVAAVPVAAAGLRASSSAAEGWEDFFESRAEVLVFGMRQGRR